MTALITYDLNRPGQDYARLIDAIKGLGGWLHPLESTWLVKTDLTVSAIRDYLKQFIDGTDELLVMDVSGAAWASQASQVANTWLGANV
jgi:hypothetical protein